MIIPITGRLATLGLLCVCSTAVGCRRRARDGHVSSRAVTGRCGADPTIERARAALKAKRTVDTLIVDLDCDNGLDTAIIAARERPSFHYELIVSMSGRTDSVTVKEDGPLPLLIQAGDLDGDRLRDIVLVDIDDGTIMPAVIRVRRDSLVFTGYARGTHPMDTQYVVELDAKTRFMDCTWEAMPKIWIIPGTGPVVSIARGGGPTPNCKEISKAFVKLQGDTRIVLNPGHYQQ